MSLKNLSAAKKIPNLLKNKLDNKRINQVYKRFEKSLNINQNFIVGVSGGPDSLALAFLAKIYSLKKNLAAKFFVVDHKLRSNSTNEAKEVKKVLKRFLISAEILTWKGKKPVKNIQSLARKKRYELLFDKCDRLKIFNILLGHHQDDLFENFFMRILRGSGLKGLISLDKRSKMKNVSLLRPLLDERKNDLEYISKNVFNYYVKDPLNDDEKFQRIKIRKIIQGLELNGLDQKKFYNTLKNLKQSDEVVRFYVDKNLDKNSFFLQKKNQLIINCNFFKQPNEIIFRSLSDSIKAIGMKYYAARGKKIDKVIDDIKRDRLSKATLGGCIIEKINQTVIISKE